MNVLSIQSSVAVGHVGNSVADFVLSSLGHDVWRIDTVRFSNHPGYGQFRGEVTSPEAVAELLLGIQELGLSSTTGAILSGYLGSAETGERIARHVEHVKTAKPNALYLLDPVIGDAKPEEPSGRIYVAAGIPEIMRNRLVPLADIVTPNRFELEVLTGRTARSLSAVRAAAEALIERGPNLVLVTSVDGSDTPLDAIDTIVVSEDEAWQVRHKRYHRRFDGAGDCLTALFLGHLLRRRPVEEAIALAISGLLPVLDETERSAGLDLAVVATRRLLVEPPTLIKATRL